MHRRKRFNPQRRDKRDFSSLLNSEKPEPKEEEQIDLSMVAEDYDEWNPDEFRAA